MSDFLNEFFDKYPSLLLIAEALAAGFLFIFIVWWTASGAKKNRAPEE